MAKLPVQSAAEAYAELLDRVGATLPKRDAVDVRIIEKVRKGTASAESKQGIITDVEQVGGYPKYAGARVIDTDVDGMPDEWETAHGLNPNDPADAAKVAAGGGYTTSRCS